MHWKKLRLALLAGFLAIVAAPGARAKELYWSGFEVRARIDADGVLHVRERQNIVFDGDWNGGYRTFNIRTMQKLGFATLSRIDPETGREIPLPSGDLSQTDQYKWISPTNLRWRSRLPSDPPFDHKEIDYVLDYRLTNVVRQSDGSYLLDHDFAFPDREGRIEKMTVDLQVDPAWRVEGGAGGHFEASNLPPGRGFVVTVRLSRAGPGHPSGVLTILSRKTRLSLELLFFAAFAILLIDFVRAERPSGRLSPLARIAPDREWLKEKIFSWRPEEIGAAWDDSVDGDEVSALIARLAAEGKVSTRIEKSEGLLSHGVLHLKLLADHGSFSGYEKALISGLFFAGRTETDTDSIRKHYKSSGFDPAGKIRAGVEGAVSGRRGMSGARPAPSKKRTAAIAIGAAALLILSAATHTGEGGFLPAIVFSFVVAGLPALGLAFSARKKIHGFPIRLGFALALAALAGLEPFQFLGYGLSVWFVAGWMAVGLAIESCLLNLAKSREPDTRVARRREIAAARRWFDRELERTKPDLDDAWVPYLLALGLDSRVSHWFSKFGAATSRGQASTPTFSGAPSSGGGTADRAPSPFTGGGGAFGGAGATAAWVGAVGAMSAGISAPGSGSSGGGGGGGGGGGSSGGGGGGGW